MPVLTDGSSHSDATDIITINPRSSADKWRYTCPNGHTTIEPTNGGIWCRSCANAIDIEDPHHYTMLDKKTMETIPWSAIRFVEPA